MAKRNEASDASRASATFVRQRGPSPTAYALHDAKNVAAIIHANVSFLASELGASVDPAVAETIEDLLAAAERMRTLVRHAVEAQVVPEVTCSRSLVSVSRIVHDLMREMRGHAATRSVRLEVRGSPLIANVDASVMSRILLNLVENAVRYAAPGGVVEVTFARCDEGVRITVADDGVGIAPDDRRAVFEPFHSTEAESGHSGLGLAFCDAAAGAHGGWIRAEAAPTGGARFVVLLAEGLDEASVARTG